MANEITTKKYWDEFWGEGELKHAKYNLSRGVFYSHRLLIERCLDEVRRTTGKTKLRVIDCGCGEGLILRFLAEQFEDIEIWGVEYSDAVDKARQLGQHLGLDFHLIHGDLFDEWGSEYLDSFDLVVSFGLIEHFERPEEVMTQMGKLLAPGGAMMTVIPNFHGAYNFLWKLYDKRNYAYHIPVYRDQLLELHSDIGLRNLRVYCLGPMTIPGIHGPKPGLEKLAQRMITMVNGHILRRLFPRQSRLERAHPMPSLIGCAGYRPL